MSANERSLDDHPVPNVRRRRGRLVAHAAAFSIAGLLLVAVGPTSSSAAPTVQDGRFLASGTVDVNYTCNGANPFTVTILDGIGLTGFSLPATITSAAVEPAPSPGEDFDVDFFWSFDLLDTLVDKAILSGATGFSITGVSTVGVASGATGADVVGAGGPTDIQLGDGSVPVGYEVGPFTGTFNRTALVDEPITFAPKAITSTVLTQPNGIELVIACNFTGEPILTMADQDGVAPSTTTTTRPAVVAPTTTTTVAVQSGNQGNQLPRTGSENLYLVLLALGLIDVGYLALTASKAPRRGRTSSVS